MKKLLTAFLIAGALRAGAQTGAYTEQANAYIRKYKGWAIEEQQRTGIPAAITLAQGIHETQAGTSELATEANNHFGIKCKKTWTGETFAHTDDAVDECFRKYASAHDSYKDHSDYLRQTPRYAHCFEQPVTDYSAWARELKAAGYATNPRYAQKLVGIIEDFHLQDYTYAAMKAPAPQGEGLARVKEEVPVNAQAARQEERPAPIAEQPVPEPEVPVNAAPATAEEYTEPVPVYGQTMMRNNLRGFYAHKGDVLLEAAIKNGMRYAKLLELNDLPDAPLEADMFVYTEKKRGIGLRNKHTVKPGETMLQVAQAEGVQLKQLRLLNGLKENEEPAAGTALNLQTPLTGGKPALSATTAPARNTAQTAPQSREPEMISTGHPAFQEDAVVSGAADDAEAQPAPKPVAQSAAAPRQQAVPAAEIAMPVTKPGPQTPPRSTPPPAAPPRQKTYTIADELAVGEEAPKYSPRYRAPEGTVAAPVAKPQEPTAKEEPQDDFSRLKARLDKAVYAPSKPSPAQTAAAAPAPQPRPSEGVPPAPGNSSSAPVYHTVKAGETAHGIARQNNITMKQLMDWNNLNFEAIKTGQKLRVK